MINSNIAFVTSLFLSEPNEDVLPTEKCND